MLPLIILVQTLEKFAPRGNIVPFSLGKNTTLIIITSYTIIILKNLNNS
jgi:hypothetical protein